jgi:hypothetical protein
VSGKLIIGYFILLLFACFVSPWIMFDMHNIPSSSEAVVLPLKCMLFFRYQNFDEREPGYRPREAGGRMGKCPWKMAVCGKKVTYLVCKKSGSGQLIGLWHAVCVDTSLWKLIMTCQLCWHALAG